MNKAGLVRWLKGHFFILLCAALGLIFAALTAYRYSDAISIADKMQAGRDKQESMRLNVRAAVSLPEDLKRLKGFGDRVNDSLMSWEDKAGNLAYFYAVGQRCKVKVLHVEQRGVEEAGESQKEKGKDAKKTPVVSSFSKVQFDIGVEGPFASILSYVDEVRGEHPLMRVESLVLRPATTAAGRVEEATILITVLTGTQDKAK